MALLFLWLFLGMLVFSVPMFYLMLAAPGIALWLEGKTVFLNLLMQRLYSGIDSFPLMALPFFILAGEMMTHGGVTKRMADFANSFVGHLRGGLSHVAVCSSVMLAGGCVTKQPYWQSEQAPATHISPLPPEARQPPAPPWCSPTCSHGLTRERESWRKRMTGPEWPD